MQVNTIFVSLFSICSVICTENILHLKTSHKNKDRASLENEENHTLTNLESSKDVTKRMNTKMDHEKLETNKLDIFQNTENISLKLDTEEKLRSITDQNTNYEDIKKAREVYYSAIDAKKSKFDAFVAAILELEKHSGVLFNLIQKEEILDPNLHNSISSQRKRRFYQISENAQFNNCKKRKNYCPSKLNIKNTNFNRLACKEPFGSLDIRSKKSFCKNVNNDSYSKSLAILDELKQDKVHKIREGLVFNSFLNCYVRKTPETSVFSFVYECKLIEKYRKLVDFIEKSLVSFVSTRSSLSCLNIDELLYNLNLSIKEGFKNNNFCIPLDELTEKLTGVLTTIDMLDEFLESLDLLNVERIIMECNDPIDLEKVHKPKCNLLMNEVYAFLKSKDSKYIKSVCPQLYSFLKVYRKLKNKENYSGLKSFIIFMVLLKRNTCIIPKIVQKIREPLSAYQIEEVFNTEIVNSSVYIYIFLKYLPLHKHKNILPNLGLAILVRCKILDKKNMHTKRISFDIVFLVEYMIFELDWFEIDKNIINILEFDNSQYSKYMKLLSQIKKHKKLKKSIYKFWGLTKKKLKENLNSIFLTPELRKRIMKNFNNSNNLQIKRLVKYLNINKRYITYVKYFKFDMFQILLNVFYRNNL